MTFFRGARSKNNNIVFLCAKLSEFSQSVVESNRRLLLSFVNNDGSIFDDAHVGIYEKLNKSKHASQQCINTVSVIKELCMIRDEELPS